MIPAGWSMAFFESLVYTSGRVGGQRERQTQAYEAGSTYFPRDYPCIQTYEDWAAKREATEKEIWERKPPAKRVNYEKLKTKHPWRVNWYELLGISTPESPAQSIEVPDFVPTEREPPNAVQAQNIHIRPWLLRGVELAKILSSLTSVLNHGAALHEEINRLRLKRGQDILSSDIKPADLLRGALVNVKVTMCSRGSPGDLAMMYALSDDAVRQWEKTLNLRKSGKITLDQDTPKETDVRALHTLECITHSC